MHRGLKRFGFSGTIRDDSDIPRLREQYEAMVIDDMRESGYIPVLDLGPFWSTSYDGGKYEFIISLYGLYVGKRKAWELSGVDGHGTLYPKNTQRDRSNQS